jgi:hypothetical protein
MLGRGAVLCLFRGSEWGREEEEEEEDGAMQRDERRAVGSEEGGREGRGVCACSMFCALALPLSAKDG